MSGARIKEKGARRMTMATEHYDRLLAAHYTWMLGGDIAAIAKDQARLLSQLGVSPGAAGALAVDLGCGPGTQSLALAELGFAPVLAVDTSRTLLSELSGLAGRTGYSSAIRPLHTDIRGALAEHTRPSSVAAVACMGDTLTHLPAKEDIDALLRDAARSLAANGQLVLSYRDLTIPRIGADRFLPVRATEDKIMTCFLEYTDHDTVLVHDLIHTRSGHTWHQQVSSYPKLRISSTWLTGRCHEAGLDIQHNTAGPGGLRIITATKPGENQG
jgi:SAM-dependent methyltransferase